MVKALRVRRPAPRGSGTADHFALAALLGELASGGIASLVDKRPAIAAYRDEMQLVDPDALDPGESLAYWLNLYNAGALHLAATAAAAGEPTVLRVAKPFNRHWAQVAGEDLSLHDIEHGKVRRFGDPRIHAALVCGSASCPTLRHEPYRGAGLEGQLESQMLDFLRNGGAGTDGKQLLLSRIFLWYGSDFVRPHRMPSFLPVTKRAVGSAVGRWLEPELAALPVAFQPYDWGLACAIG
jgi:hypothetical protein